MEWTLEDVEAASRLYPESFFIPSEQERNAQQIGKMVRLHFVISNPAEGEPRAERMWVEITGQDPMSRRYTGILTNAPASLKTLHLGDTVEFEPRHIAQTIVREGDPLWLAVGEKMALVSRRCLEPGNAVHWMYREAPDQEQDSGWRLFAGDEDEAYLNDPQNTRVMRIYYIMDMDPSLLEPFKGEAGAAFERASRDGEWVQVRNWKRG
ncbi:DUF2185 domain-containing protein [Paenibacillus sp. PK3_47]|uniref:immunity protein Imm33 domain-containing protein n=1 Tax=Paenibacillus sp. PK3_47 TaxID=2072642 RepID=UPI00201DD340|nr:DUF2185 domain-containing protein [Paenibacillus sp. PK3_47]UQZ32205.1 DUF2185 domain-containing protein [Paenibacillus sp. PK3_47]